MRSLSVLRLAARAPRLRAPVTSTLGGMNAASALASSAHALWLCAGTISTLRLQEVAVGSTGCLLGELGSVLSFGPLSCQRLRAPAPRGVPLRSRPSAFAGIHRGHPFRQLRLRCTAASTAARWREARFVFSSPAAFGSAACHSRRRGSWAPRSAALLGLGGSGVAGEQNAA